MYGRGGHVGHATKNLNNFSFQKVLEAVYVGQIYRCIWSLVTGFRGEVV